MATYRYPSDLATDPTDKWVLFKLIDRPSLTKRVAGAISGAPEGPKTLTTVVLPIPVSAMKTGYSVSYEELSMGSTIGAVLQNINPEKIAAMGKQLSRDSVIDVLKQSSGTFLKSAYDLILAEARDSTGKALETLGFDNATEIIDRTSRSTINQRIEVLFKNVRFRTHTFTYQFMPRTAPEAEAIRNILSIFKIGMLPGFEVGASKKLSDAFKSLTNVEPSGEGIPDMYFSFPYEWEIEFSQNHAKNTFQILNSVLETMEVDHAAAGQVAFFKDGHPVATSVSLTFRETVLLTRDQYSEQIKNTVLVDNANPNKRTYRF